MRFCLAIVAILAVSCQSVPWIGSLLNTKPAEHLEEEVLGEAAEGAAYIAGKNVHVEIDIDPQGDPRCMNCSIHCPKK